MKEASDSQVCYESSHRILKLMTEMETLYPEARVTLARELTKQFEELLEGTPAELRAVLESKPEKQKGEFVVIVSK